MRKNMATVPVAGGNIKGKQFQDKSTLTITARSDKIKMWKPKTVATVKQRTQFQQGVKPKNRELSAATDGSLLFIFATNLSPYIDKSPRNQAFFASMIKLYKPRFGGAKIFAKKMKFVTSSCFG